jgi:CO/xanthine dehydrogenase FAD-binding subunit
MDLPFIESLDPATDASLAGWRDGDAWLAGGTALFSEPAPNLRRLWDLRAFGWPALSISSEGLEIAATCTLEQLYTFTAPSHWSAASLFRQCPEALLASWKVWQEATVGGNICYALPAGAMTAMTAALDGVATVLSPPGGAVRRLRVAELVTGDSETALAPGELLRAISIPPSALTAEVAFRQVSLSPRGRSAALVIGRRELDDTTVITVTAAVPRPLQLRFTAAPSAAELTLALEGASPTWFDDVHGDADWRAHLTGLLCEQVRTELGGEG